MKFTFVNQTIFTIPTDLKVIGGQFDGLGKMQFINRGITEAKANVFAIEEKFKSAFYRQEQEEKFLTSKAAKTYFEDKIKDFPFSNQGKLDTVLIYSKSPGYIEKWSSINVYGLNEDYSITEEKKDFINSNGRVIVQYDNDKTPYTLVHYKFTNNIILKNIYIYKSLDQIISIRLKNNTGEWVDSTNMLAFFGIFNPEFCTFSGNNFTEAKVIYKNVKITNRYSLEAKVKVSKYSIYNSTNFTWKGYSANSFILGNSLYSQLEDNTYNGMYADLFIEIDNQIYQVQLPSVGAPMLKLIPEKRYSFISDFKTIFKCPYPVKTEDTQITLFTNLTDPESTIPWRASFDKVTWYTKEELATLSPYAGEYSNTPKYIYFEINGYVEECFILCQINQVTNSKWPLTEDEVIYFNGSGIGIKNPKGLPVTVTGTVYINGVVSLSENTPIAILGVD